MATAKKAAKKNASKKTTAKTVPGIKTTQAVDSKPAARAAKSAAIAEAPETRKTTNPKGSWPFPTGERP